MTPDSRLRPASRVLRGSARLIAALALVVVTAACSSGDDVSSVRSTPTPTSGMTPSTSAVTASPDASELSEPTASQAERFDSSYTLRIPRIGVNAEVVPIHSNQERILEPPSDPSVAGWWSDGAAPGEAHGSAVLVGHTVRNKGGGVFDDMGDLTRGDAIAVEASDSTLAYRVQSIEVLSKDEVAHNAEKIFAQTGAGRLVLITCDDWDGTAWRSNIVTIATPA
jgi:LPXTG-site transpeptidase (sortase) family protein